MTNILLTVSPSEAVQLLNGTLATLIRKCAQVAIVAPKRRVDELAGAIAVAEIAGAGVLVIAGVGRAHAGVVCAEVRVGTRVTVVAALARGAGRHWLWDRVQRIGATRRHSQEAAVHCDRDPQQVSVHQEIPHVS